MVPLHDIFSFWQSTKLAWKHFTQLCSKSKKRNGLHKSSVLQCTAVTKNIDLSALKKGSGKFLAGLDNLEIQILAIAGLTG